MMDEHQAPTGRNAVAIAISWATATAIALLVTNLMLRELPSELAAWMVFVGSPVLLGVAQWTVLRRLLPNAWWWIPLTIIGCGLGWVCSGGFMYLTTQLEYEVSWVPHSKLCEHLFMGVVTAVGGLGIGFIQWLYLKRYVRRAAWWLLGSAIALGVGAGFNLSAGIAATFDSGHNWLLSLSIGGLLGGGIKGATLAWLMRQRS
ncbi:MAG: hypothetical protein AAGE92_04655 [Cyanobacteria bacterium P01_G01_bin.4]